MLSTELPAELGEDLNTMVETIQQDPGQWLDHVKQSVLDFLPSLGTALLVFVVGYVLIRAAVALSGKALGRSRVDVTLHYFIKVLIRFVLLSVLIVTCLGLLEIPLTPIITAVGAIALALSLAVQDSLSNLAGGIFLLFARPFSVGDYIEAGSVAGTVKEIRLVYTVLTTVDNRNVYLPNGDSSKSVIVNYSAQPMRRLDLEFTVRADCDLTAAKRIIREVVESGELALRDPEPIVRVSDQSFMLVKIACLVWTKPADLFTLKDELIVRVRERLTKEGFSSSIR